VEGKYKISYVPKQKLPVEDFLRPQGRFRHLFKKGNAFMIEQIQQEIDERWEMLLKLAE